VSDATAERWLPIPEHPGYEASDQGRIRTVTRRVSRGPGRGTRWVYGRVLKARLNPDSNRYYVGVWLNSKMELHSVHTLVLKAFVGPRPDGLVACHNDGDPTNNRLENLRWDTQSSNIADSIRQGTHVSVRKTHCPSGHLLAEPNLDASRLNKGHRSCLTCTRARHARTYAAKTGRPFDWDATAARYYADIMEAPSDALHDTARSEAS
jgi:hypothetical protein